MTMIAETALGRARGWQRVRVGHVNVRRGVLEVREKVLRYRDELIKTICLIGGFSSYARASWLDSLEVASLARAARVAATP